MKVGRLMSEVTICKILLTPLNQVPCYVRHVYEADLKYKGKLVDDDSPTFLW